MTPLATDHPPWFPVSPRRRPPQPARATWLDPELGRRIRTLRAAGLTYKAIAETVGVAESTAWRWCQ